MSSSLSNCLCVGTNLSWFAWRWASMVVLGYDSTDCVLHGESSQAGKIKTTRSGVGILWRRQVRVEPPYAYLLVRILGWQCKILIVGN
jgi:hypothetical protein